jgi:hypothetical protein
MRRALLGLALGAVATAALVAYGRGVARRRDLESAPSVSMCDWCGRPFSTLRATHRAIIAGPDAGQSGVFCSGKHSQKWSASLSGKG